MIRLIIYSHASRDCVQDVRRCEGKSIIRLRSIIYIRTTNHDEDFEPGVSGFGENVS